MRLKPLPRALRDSLASTFGHERLRPVQRRVVDRVLAGLPTLAVMPTGAGKSLCYQLPGLALPGRTLVVSPLIALMKDQCDRLQALGIGAVQLHSGLGSEEEHRAESAAADGCARFVFVTPERLSDRGFMALLKTHPTSLLVVDEAHCLSHRGPDFRPAFQEIGPALPGLGRPTVLALTAAATPAVADDIAQQLGIPADGIVNSGAYRHNLHYAVHLATNEAEKLQHLLRTVAAEAGQGIVYTATVKATRTVHAALTGAGHSVGLHHSRQPAAQRHRVQDDFMAGRLRVVVATHGFAQDIDKPDVRFVVHHQMPDGLDAYYQESGRAGRDGEVAHCVLLYLHGDLAVQQFFLAGRYPGIDELQALYRGLHEYSTEGGAWTLPALQAVLDRPRNRLQVGLGLLRAQGLVAQDRRGRLRLLRPGLEPRALQALAERYQERRTEDRAMLERMVAYAQTGACRWQVLLDHFGARPEGFEACHHCDNCLRADQRLLDARALAQAPALPAVGQPVRVRRYGIGVVAAADAGSVTVDFGNGELRIFLPGYVAAVAMRAPRRRKIAA